jgi:secreted PhoX family phosphatase
MGTFMHESACVDPVREEVYMTEDRPDGCFYRFTPSAYPDLSRGRLEAAVVAGDGAVSWVPVDPLPIPAPPKIQAQRKGATTFRGGEGTWWDGGIAYFTTKGDNRVWAYDCEQQRIEVLYDAAETGPEAPLRGVDNICVARSGDVYVCEDGDDLDLCLITPDREVARFCTFDPGVHRDTELVGVTFDPSGTRMYLGSQRSFTLGALYEITGPFRQPPPPVEPPSFGRDLPDGSVEDRLGSLAAVRVPTRISARELRGPGLPVRLALREPCVVKARLRGPLGAQVGYETFPTAVTGLTALRLKAPVTLTGRHELKVIVEPTGGGGVRETARSVTVT